MLHTHAPATTLEHVTRHGKRNCYVTTFNIVSPAMVGSTMAKTFKVVFGHHLAHLMVAAHWTVAQTVHAPSMIFSVHGVKNTMPLRIVVYTFFFGTKYTPHGSGLLVYMKTLFFFHIHHLWLPTRTEQKKNTEAGHHWQSLFRRWILDGANHPMPDWICPQL